jgi:dihydrofolate synthase/folylpolyglutamate synthase
VNFEESVKYLYSLGNEVSAMKLGLENPRKLLQALGNPQDNYKKIQIAGTNGKGSTCAFLDSICRQAGIKTGLYTSPHLVSITERIKIEGEEISKEDFAKYTTIVKSQIANREPHIPATFFEQMTAIAILAFAEKGVELAILETGLGGRLDATTAAQSEIVAITPIDYDHQQYLGETLTEIAGEKAAIINSPNQQVVIAKQPPEAEKGILERCRAFGITPITDSRFQISDSRLGLAGKHQIENAKVAVCLAEILKIDKQHIINGLETATHKGRLEFYDGILFDGAHNIAGAKALHEYLEEFISQPITLIFGAMRDKQIDEMAKILFPTADKLILTQIDNPRSATAEELSQFTKRDLIVTKNVEEALETAKSFSENLTCVTGSLYLVGEAQKILNHKK